MKITDRDYPVRLKSFNDWRGKHYPPELIVCAWNLSAVWIRGDKYTAKAYCDKHGYFWEATSNGRLLYFRCKETGAERSIYQKDLHKRPLTMGDAFNIGYSIAFSAYQNGYVSRKKDPADFLLQAAGGKRRGMIYALAPAFNTSRYCLRHYLMREDRKHD